MKFSLHFASNTFPDFAGAVRVAKAAEAAGFDSIFAIDHVVYPDAYTTPYPYAAGGRLPMTRASAFPDPLIWIASAAAVTTTLRFMTGVLILPLRDPFVLAKQVATLDAMSGGRFELGIGVGWLKEEFEALGAPFEQRGRRADEYIAVMRALWAGDGASFSGRYVKFEGVSCNPKPVGRVPIVVGGHSEAAARRAGRLGDGFFPSIGAQVDTTPLFEVARRAAVEAGRDPGAIEMLAGCPDLLPGSTVEPRAAIEERLKLGIGRIVVPVGAFLPDLEDGLARFGDAVIRPFAGLR